MLMIDPQQPFEGADLPLNVPGAGTLIVTLQVRAMHKEGPSSNRQYLAADIIAVAASETPECLSKLVCPQQAISGQETVVNHKDAYPVIVQRE